MKGLTAKDVMNDSVKTVRDDLELRQVAAFLAENEITGAPVVDSAGSLLGVVSLTDVARALERGEGSGVRGIMTPIADTVAEDTPVPRIARIMVDNHHHRVIVTRYEKPVGIISSIDLLKQIAELG